MHLDANSLPVQADGDANDQLQRVGLILVGLELGNNPSVIPAACEQACHAALKGALQPSPGVYSRYIGGATNTVSADQLISALAAHVRERNKKQVWLMFKAMVKRFGFAQNTRDGLNESNKWKLPDFMWLRAAPLFARASKWVRPLALAADLYLVVLAIGAVLDRNPDHVDDNNTVLTLAVCSHVFETPFSWLARKLYSKFRAWNYGCVRKFVIPPPVSMIESVVDCNAYKPPYGALRWYHRAASGGNPEVAELWEPICKRMF